MKEIKEMDDNNEDLEDERITELSAVSAIYHELVIDPSDPFSAVIDIRVEPISSLAVTFLPTISQITPLASDANSLGHNGGQNPAIAKSQGRAIHYLANLPPLALKIHLPDGYPAQKPPIFHLESKFSWWLPEKKLQELRDEGLSIWEKAGRDQVVFAYIDYLKDQAEQGFDLLQQGQRYLEMPQSIEIALLDFDLQARRTKFEQATFECGVCLGTRILKRKYDSDLTLLEPKKGSVCHRLLLCSHVFCVQCLQDFFNNCINEGDVTSVKCMAPSCGSGSSSQPTSQQNQRRKLLRREDRTLDPSELLRIPLDEDTVQKYVRLKRKQRLESDPSTIYCPRQWCQGPARSTATKSISQGSDLDSDFGSDSDDTTPQSYDSNANPDKLPPPSERLAICKDCAFAFCIVCKVSWHGEFFSCFPRKQSEITAEERATEEYLRLRTTACPTCGARCQKTMGCNHMICFKCKWHFCYLCSSWLDQDNPYKHFNTPKLPCYMRLWEQGEGTDGYAAFMNAQRLIDDDSDDDDIPGAPNPQQAPQPAPQPAPPRPRIPPPQPRDPPHQPNRERPAHGLGPANPPPPPEPARHGRPLGRRARIELGLEPMLVRVHDRAPPMQGLQRFLQMARDDVEDEWDSDEMGDGEEWEIFR